tara:strand:+ start:20563 stop:20964 length:402 start_codon:yes stop_codon:yes gene_type:complete
VEKKTKIFMLQKIQINLSNITLYGYLEINDFTKKIISKFPLESDIQFWGDEIYFPISIYENPSENLREVVNKGDIAYWPPGNAFCIFWGPTPMSKKEEIRPASPVKVIGYMDSDPTSLSQFSNGEKINIKVVN